MYKRDKILILLQGRLEQIDIIYTAIKWAVFTSAIVLLTIGFIMVLSLWMLFHILLLPIIIIHDKILELRK